MIAAMDEARRIKISKYLSKHLRHQPERLGLTLEPGGWVDVETLLEACARNHLLIRREELDEVVTSNDKRRFAFDETGRRIRADLGHSAEIDLQHEPVDPPERLYHGTGHRAAEAITVEGLQKMRRHHVHLSPDIETARGVGARHGWPVTFVVDTVRMHQDGHTFFWSANGVWLVEHVPASYLKRL